MLLSSLAHEIVQRDWMFCRHDASVLYCVLKLCTVISTLRWAVLTVLWIGVLSHWAHFTVLRFICVYLCVFVFILHSCIIVNTVGWTWWDWSLILRTYLPSVLWHCWLGHMIRKNPSPIWPITCLVVRWTLLNNNYIAHDRTSTCICSVRVVLEH